MKRLSIATVLIILFSLSILLISGAAKNKNAVELLLGFLLIAIGILIGIKTLIKD